MRCLFQIAKCDLYNFSFSPIDSRMYLVVSNNQALVIDPCVNEEALQILRDNRVSEVLVLPTHEHYDHISGINWLRSNFKCNIIASEQCSKNMMDPRRNASVHFDVLFIFASDEIKEEIAEAKVQPYSCAADEVFNEYRCFTWQGHKVEIQETPGHSKGSVCILIDKKFIFTGDSLMKGIPTITRLPGGSKKDFSEKTLPFLKSLPSSAMIFPGHGDSGYMHELFVPSSS